MDKIELTGLELHAHGRQQGEDYDLVITAVTLRPRRYPVATKIGDRYRQPSARDRREYESSPRVYVSVEGETLLQDFVSRMDRPQRAFKAAARVAIEQFGLTRKLAKLRWSQKAGCSCGCSPGFVMKPAVLPTIDGEEVGHGKYDLWVTVTGLDAETKVTPRVVARAEAIASDPTIDLDSLAATILTPDETDEPFAADEYEDINIDALRGQVIA